jgi:hypothetical protein
MGQAGLVSIPPSVQTEARLLYGRLLQTPDPLRRLRPAPRLSIRHQRTVDLLDMPSQITAMGQAKQRGTFEERRLEAIRAGRVRDAALKRIVQTRKFRVIRSGNRVAPKSKLMQTLVEMASVNVSSKVK